MNAEEYLAPETLSDETVPWAGSMPDLQAAYPWSADIFGNPDRPNGAVWPYRLTFGAEDDVDRDKVSEWRKVDDLGGITTLWAGVYAGKIFLAAQDDSPPAAAEDTDEAGGAQLASGLEVWNAGQPVLPYTPVAMDARDTMLKNDAGEWRRLVWEPIGLFDIFPNKYVMNNDTTWAIRRFTLYCVVEGSWVAFYTTSAELNSGLYENGQPARWPFSYYLSRNRSGELFYEPGGKDGGLTFGSAANANGYRLAPLPWQMENGGSLAAAVDFTSDGVHEGQRYALPPVYPCPRYLAAAFDGFTDEAITEAAIQNDGTFALLSAETAKQAIIGSIRTAATEYYSIDPGLMEELGREFPDGAQAHSVWTDTPNEYKVVFSHHIDGSDVSWPHWLALMSADAPTGLLMASVCRHYNDYNPSAPGPGIPGNGSSGEDEPAPGNTPPSPEDPAGPRPDNPNPDDDTDDDETDDDTSRDPLRLDTGYYYEAGNGVQIRREWAKTGFKHYIHINPVSASGQISYDVRLTVQTQSDSQTYNIPVDGWTGVNMWYGVSAADDGIRVNWLSSATKAGSNAVPDRLAKTATWVNQLFADYSFTAEFDDWEVHSDTPPSFFGSLFSLLATGRFEKRGTYKKWDTFAQRWKTIRYVREFKKYSLSIDKAKLKEVIEAKAPALSVTVSPGSISGTSDDLGGPTVTAIACSATVSNKPSLNVSLGQMRPEVNISLTFPAPPSAPVKGSGSWQGEGRKSGSISGIFNLTMPTNVNIQL